ncbi:MAG: histone deacetylase [Thermoplasmata archaeon]
MKVIYHSRYMDHQHLGTHPERPERLEGALSKLDSLSLLEDLIYPGEIEKSALSLIHSEGYIETLSNLANSYLDGGDTFVASETYDIAKKAVSGALLSVEESLKGNKNVALLRPPGHHAGVDYGGGFCYLNNIAIGARYAGIDRVAIVDIDAHHGNGTSDIFYRDPGVLYISTHHYGIYPGTGAAVAVGEDEGQGYNVNIPFPAGSGDSSMEFGWKRVIDPILRQYDPELILVSLGTDGHYADAMTGLSLSSRGYIDICKKLASLADELCGGKISYMLEGGYQIPSLAEIVAGIVSEKKVELEFDDTIDNSIRGEGAVSDTANALGKYWNL